MLIDNIRGLPGLSYPEMKLELAELYGADCCDGIKLEADIFDAERMATILANMVADIWKRKGMPPSINKTVTTAFAKTLWGGLTKGYGKDLVSIAYDTPDGKMLQHLQHSVYTFSAAKNYHQLKSLSQALVGDDGKLNTYSQFRKLAFEINDTHVNQWLKTEYNTAVAGGQMASKWVDIERTKDVLPLLEFDAIMDGRTTELCSSLHGVLLKVDDPFWTVYYPPNHFGCRSSVRKRAGGKETPADKIAYPEKMPDMFKVNLAQQGLAFPKGHAYFKELPDDVLVQATKLIPKKEE